MSTQDLPQSMVSSSGAACLPGCFSTFLALLPGDPAVMEEIEFANIH